MTMGQPWPWPEAMDELMAAPDSHCVVLDNDRARVLEVTIESGIREPEHTDQAPSIMITDEAARSGTTRAARCLSPGTLRVSVRRAGALDGTRGPHPARNTGRRRYHAIRIQLR